MHHYERMLLFWIENSTTQPELQMPRSTSKKQLKRPEKRATLAKAVPKKTQPSPPKSVPEQTAALETVSVSGYAIRDPISHSHFGEGVITAIDGRNIP